MSWRFFDPEAQSSLANLWLQKSGFQTKVIVLVDINIMARNKSTEMVFQLNGSSSLYFVNLATWNEPLM